MSFLESREALAPEGIGKSVRRREDARLLTGGGRYADDFSLPGQVYACLVRSPHAHARIVGDRRGGGARRARGARGADRRRCGGGRAAADPAQPGADEPARSAAEKPRRLARSSSRRTRFWRSTRCAMSASRSRSSSPKRSAQAMDAAELVEVDYEPLPAVARSRDALAPGAPVVWQRARLQSVRRFRGRRQGRRPRPLSRGAAHVVRLETTINRVTGVPMELRAGARRLRRGGRRGSPSIPAPAAASSGSATTSPERSGCRRTRCASSPAMSAAISASATTPVRSSCWSPGRRNGSAGRSNGGASASDAFLTDFHGRDLTSRGRARARRGRQLPRPARHQHQQSRRQRDFVRAAGEGDRDLVRASTTSRSRTCAAAPS